MDLSTDIFHAPWRLGGGLFPLDDAPDDGDPDGWRQVVVRLGVWVSPAGYPWDVAATRGRWAEVLVDEPADAPDNARLLLLPPVISLILYPRPWRVPGPPFHEAFDAWAAAVDARNRRPVPAWSWRGQSGRWMARRSRPGTAARLWEHSSTGPARVVDLVPASRPYAHRLRRLWERAPWLFLLDDALAGAMGDLGGAPLGVGDLARTVAGRGARHGWAAHDPPDRPPRSLARPLRIGGYEALRARDAAPQRAAAFVDGKDSDAARRAQLRASAVDDQHRRWKQDLDADLVHPYLVPLATDVDLRAGVAAESWASRWLVDGRAALDLWRVFGRSLAFLRWTPEASGPDALWGAAVYDAPECCPVIVPSPARDWAGWAARWRTDGGPSGGADDPRPAVSSA